MPHPVGAARPFRQHDRLGGADRTRLPSSHAGSPASTGATSIIAHPGLPRWPRRVSAAIARELSVDVLILGNHGLVVGATTCEAAETMVADVEQRLALMPRDALAADRDALRSICAGTDYRAPADPRCHGIATDRHNLAAATGGSLYPDHRRVSWARDADPRSTADGLRAADLKKTDGAAAGRRSDPRDRQRDSQGLPAPAPKRC